MNAYTTLILQTCVTLLVVNCKPQPVLLKWSILICKNNEVSVCAGKLCEPKAHTNTQTHNLGQFFVFCFFNSWLSVMSERREILNMVISDLQKPHTPDVQACLQRSAMQKKGGAT